MSAPLILTVVGRVSPTGEWCRPSVLVLSTTGYPWLDESNPTRTVFQHS